MSSEQKTPKKRLDNSIVGYVTNVSPIKTAKNNPKRKYFDFLLNTEDKMERTVCFSPEKHKLVSEVHKDLTGCEIKKYKRSDTNDIIITDFSSVKKLAPSFELQTPEVVLKTIPAILNESMLYEIVNTKAYLYELSETKALTDKNGKNMSYRNAILIDETSEKLPITFYNEQCGQVKNKETYILTELRVSKYMNNRFLKATPFTKLRTVDPLEINDEAVTVTDCTSHFTITSVDLKSFSEKFQCPSCKSNDLEVEKDYTICNNCCTMTDASQCRKHSNIGFTAEGDTGKLVLDCSPSLLEKCFGIPCCKKIPLAKKMIKANVIVKFDQRDNSIIEIRLKEDNSIKMCLKEKEQDNVTSQNFISEEEEMVLLDGKNDEED